MDPDANLQEQERILLARKNERHLPRNYISLAERARRRVRLNELRTELWRWLHRRGFEPQWSKCPLATRHFQSYGGSIGPEHYK